MIGPQRITPAYGNLTLTDQSQFPTLFNKPGSKLSKQEQTSSSVWDQGSKELVCICFTSKFQLIYYCLKINTPSSINQPNRKGKNPNVKKLTSLEKFGPMRCKKN